MGNSFISNIRRDIVKKAKTIFHNPYSPFGISWSQVKIMRNQAAGTMQQLILFGKPFFYNKGEEVLHALDEIFIAEFYKIKFDTRTPFIIDCGAHIGMSVLYCKQKYPGARIIAFEPDEVNYNILSKNITNAGLNGVDLRNEAVWIENTTLNFAGTGSMSSRIDEMFHENSVTVKAIRLKDILHEEVNFLKLDIEGAEYKVILDIKEKLHFIQYLFIEYHGSFKQNSELNEILQIIADAGFKYYIKEAAESYKTPFLRNGQTAEYDLQLNIFCFRN